MNKVGMLSMCCRFSSNYMTLEYCCLHSPPVYCLFKNIPIEGKKTDKYEANDKIMHNDAVSLQVVDHLFLGDEMRGFVDQRHEGVEFVRPVVKQVVGVFGPLKVDDTSQPVDLGIDGLVYDKAR